MHFVKEIVLFGAAAAFLLWCLESVITDGVAKAIERSGLTRLDFETQIENSVREALSTYFKERDIARPSDF